MGDVTLTTQFTFSKFVIYCTTECGGVKSEAGHVLEVENVMQ